METSKGALVLLCSTQVRHARGSSVDLQAGGGQAALQWLSLAGLCCSCVNAIRLGL